MAGKIARIWEVLAACFEENKEALTKAQILAWIGNKYPANGFTLSTLEAQLYRSCYNVPSVQIYKAPKILIYNKADKTYALRGPSDHLEVPNIDDPTLGTSIDEDDDDQSQGSSTFVLEAHLRDYLAINLHILEKGLQLWSLNPPSVEYFLDGRSIDILAKDTSGTPVVIELKRQKSYDRAVGQALLYQGLVAARLATTRVRIILVAGAVSDELKIASARLADIMLFEYSIAMQVKEVSSSLSEDI